MPYRVEMFTISTGIFGRVKTEKLLTEMRDKLNALEKAGYEIVSVIQLHSDSNDFNYEIISKKPPQPEE